MGFQILDKNKNPICINELDLEACKLWNKEQHPKYYAYPQHEPESFPTDDYKTRWEFLTTLTNWYDRIGWIINDGCVDWDEMISKIMEPYREFTDVEQVEIQTIFVPVSGYIQLINHWKNKKYKPKQIKD